ncbi:hypothetical protein Tco_0224070 [Tanacetum coccineum]
MDVRIRQFTTANLILSTGLSVVGLKLVQKIDRCLRFANVLKYKVKFAMLALRKGRNQRKGYISKPATLHDAINMARELIKQGIQAKALRSVIAIKEVEDKQGNKSITTGKNRRQEAAKVYVAAPAKGRGYTGNLPWCNRCKAHHHLAGGNLLQNVTCFGCGNQGHYRSDVPGDKEPKRKV